MKTLVLFILAAFVAVALAQPTDPTTPPPVQPAPIQPTPSQPEPTTPVPTQPAATTPDPSLPAPVPAPTNPVVPASPSAKPAPVPAKPVPKPIAKPAPKPVPKPAKILPLELRLETSEQEIRGGELREVPIVRTFAVPQKSTELSRKNKKPSAGLENLMQRTWRSLAQVAQDAVWLRDGKDWIARQQSAWRVDETLSRAYVLEALKFNKPSAKIIVRRSQPSRNVLDWYNKGIRYHFGGGESFFRGSSNFRVTNIIAGSKQLDNTYLAAGAVFDFNRDVKISKELGFVDGYIIKGGILEKDIGGGICQVSSTVWRAAYNAGLPIVQRNYHSYRVHYYDPPGFEATVFAPYKNLKFRNDTGAPLFIQVTWYLRSSKLEMHFFGAKPDRRVSISDGYISNVRQPPAPRFVADPEVRLGRAKRLSGAERGMNVRIDRVVRYDNGQVARDSTFSSYVPWGELWAVNPNDARLRANIKVPSTSSLPMQNIPSATAVTPMPIQPIVAASLPSLSKPAAGGAPER